ncbi:hypothetical protein VSDG_05864 [Cytospora chrysosperma]|uniref:Uncharacterized protein n=1 Tax=Cytospora chrysosperma TaxID=252740 RepID=A0A423VVM3_CYTCH|nr:hypothetical protein VSDG_05864 [Valsa sordida]
MFEQLALRHIPALFVASTMTFGGVWPIFNARGAMLEFGFPSHIASVPAAAPVMVIGQVRTTVIGLLVFLHYSRNQLDVVDTIMAITGAYAGLLDSYVKRTALAAVFLIGFLAVIASVVGLVYRILVNEASGDPAWNGININISTAGEIFGTVIVSCTPSFWSFWFNIFTKSQLYFTIRSTIWNRSKPAQSTSFLRTLKQSHGHHGTTCNCEQCRQMKHFHYPTSSEGLVESLPPQAAAIQKSTLISYKVSDEPEDIEMQQAQAWQNTSREEWRLY